MSMSIEDLRKAKEGGNEEKVREAKQEVREAKQEVREAEEKVEKAKEEVRVAEEKVEKAKEEVRVAEEKAEAKVMEEKKVEVKKAKQAKHRSFALQMTVETTDQNGRIQNVTTGDETMSREDSLRSFS